MMAPFGAGVVVGLVLCLPLLALVKALAAKPGRPVEIRPGPDSGRQINTLQRDVSRWKRCALRRGWKPGQYWGNR